MEKFNFIDLTHKVHSDIPTWDMTCGYYIKTMRDYRHCDGEFKFRSQALDIRASAGTHIDSPSHCFEGSRDVSEIKIEELVRPCIVIDVSQQAKQNENYKISEQDIKNFENKHGEIKAGNFVLFYTGWSQFWNDPKKYHNNLSFPNVSKQAAEILLKKQVCGIGIDTLSPDCDENAHDTHAIFLGANKYIVENVANADKMPATGAYISIMPLNVKGAAESPVRLVGFVPKTK